MMAKHFDIGALIWVKHKDFPFQRGIITEPPVDVALPKDKKPRHFVYFSESNNHDWVLDKDIFLQDDHINESDSKEESDTKNTIKGKADKKSQEKGPKSVNYVCKESKNKVDGSISVKEKSVQVQEKKKAPVRAQRKKKAPIRVQRKKPPLPSVNTTTDGAGSSLSYPKYRVKNEYADSMANVLPSVGGSPIAAVPSCSSSYYQLPKNVKQPSAPTLDLSDDSETLGEEESGVCSKNIGFLGLGIMGQAMVKNLLNVGHHVTVWNETPHEMDDLVEVGATKGQTPASVVRSCHITFCCLSYADADAAKDILFSNFGVLNGLDSSKNKGYVEMSTIDPETSQYVATKIKSKGGRYLEAPINWSRKNAIEGTLTILAAGDRTLFYECETYFYAMARHAFYMSPEVGVASKMNLVRSMLHGTLCASLAEAVAVTMHCGLSAKDFMLILQHGSLSCEAFMEKAQAMIQRNYSTNTPINHMQNDLELALSLGDAAEQPLLLAAAANELYVRARQDNANQDVSAVYQTTSISYNR